MKIFKGIIVIIIVASFSLNLQSQDRKDRIEAQKVTYITTEISLTTEEAQKFWPVYNEYQQKKRELQQTKRSYMMLYRQSVKASNNEIEGFVDGFIDTQFKESELLKEYHEKYKTVLPIEKVIKFYQAEIHFKQFLLKQIKGQGAGERQRPKRGF